MPKDTIRTAPAARTLLTLSFFSGFAGLVYQVLWMRQLGLLFGNTAYAASATLSSFFAGLAVGSWFWGKRSGRSPRPIRLFARLEVGIAVTSLLYFAILAIFSVIYPVVYRSITSPVLMVLFKFALALLLVFPPSFCMGGTLPVMSQYLVRDPSAFGRTSALLYGTNTFGAAIGAACAAFFLVPLLGFNLTCTVAILISIIIAGVAWRLSRRSQAGDKPSAAEEKPDSVAPAAPMTGRRLALAAICFLSGFGVLSLEVVWTRIFAQVHTNSVYAFAVILVVVLTCLALGAWVSARLARSKLPPLLTLGVLLAFGGITLAFGPELIMQITDGLRVHSSIDPWAQYMGELFFKGFASIGIVVLVLGTIFPFLMKMEEDESVGAGQALGRLLALNTVGSIVGAVVCGFVLLPALGMWCTMRLITILYLAAGLLLPYGRGVVGNACRAACVLFLIGIFTILDPANLPTSGFDAARPREEVIETWEGIDCTVAVVEHGQGARSIRINSAYTLGSTTAYGTQVNQSAVPLNIFPDTRSIFFLGMGTGISAGAALNPRFEHVERIVSCELVPEVVEAARLHMPPLLTGGIFTDPRSTVLVEDGRHVLMASDETYDMINADLFLPYRRGAGSLYSLEHYRHASKRLSPGGVFVQWVPLYQITEQEFGIIARTMLEVFPQVTMWRGSFQPGKEVVALIGQLKPGPIPALSASTQQQTLPHVDDFSAELMGQAGIPVPLHSRMIPFLYCGDLSAARQLFADFPVNTDDRPLIEYLAPRLFRQFAKDPIIWFVGPKFAVWTKRLLAACPPETDPVLQLRTPANRKLVHAGAAFHLSLIWRALSEPQACVEEWDIFTREWNAARAAQSTADHGPRTTDN